MLFRSDAAATALFVAGPAGWQVIALRMEIDRVMLVDREGVIHLTPAMQQIITLPEEVTANVVVHTP